MDASENLDSLRTQINHLRQDVDSQREEIDKLGKVMTEVVGREFDAIMGRQEQDLQSILHWVTLSLSMSTAILRELQGRGLVDADQVRDHMAGMRRRLIEHAESIGSDPDVATFFDAATGE